MNDTTTSSDAWTIDSLLAEAKRLQSILEPLFTWDHIRSSANICNLGVFSRHPIPLRLYEDYFTPLIKEQYGSVEKYLVQSLGTWDKQIIPADKEWWTREMEVKLRINDWPYALPTSVVHYVIWTPTAVVHQDHFNSSWTWDDISRQGLAGFTGLNKVDKEVYVDIGGLGGPGLEMSEFVKENWKEDEFETVWYVNPPRLQSVRGLAHFHVLAKPKLFSSPPQV